MYYLKMAASCERLLRTNKILNILNSGTLWTRHFASNPQGKKENANSSDSKTDVPDRTDEAEKPKSFMSIWTDPLPESNRGDHLPNPVRNTEREYFQNALDPNRQTLIEGKYYSKKHGISKDVYAWLHWDLNINDNDEIRALLKRHEFNQHKIDQRLLDERFKAVGPELGAAHFVISRGGAVKFAGRDHWYALNSENKYSIPKVFVENLFIEAIDASKMNLTYVGFDNFESLSHLRYLRFNNCPYIDDWCLSRLQRLKHTLEHLDISNCPGITDNGLSSLHCLQNLKVLRLSNLTNVKHVGLLALLLEENIPDLTILGVKDEELKPPVWKHRGERRLARALLGYLDEDDGETIGEVKELPSADDKDFDNIWNRVIRRVE